MQTAVQLVKGEKVESNVLIPYQLITQANYQQFADKTRNKP